ncbi:MAG: shikimate dehydrogenase [Dehalococcoidales bacterium]|nr:shikimate dehydrogenase [Dehalococcoidales bacterium]
MRDRVISGKTIVCGVIGDPIEHTMSPVMHNTAFKTLGLDYVYVAFNVKSLELGKAVDGIRGLDIRGMNVTIPHKKAVMQFLNRIDPLAERIGAVNTIVNDGGILTGYNTDADGFLQALHDKDIEPRGKKVLLLGAGGAARAIAFTLLEEHVDLTILNRKEELSWVEELVRHLTQYYGVDIDAGELTPKNLEKALDGADILVNATSVGMSPDSDKSLVPEDLLCSRLVVFDVVYNPFQTKLLKEAKQAGARTIDGLEMLVWQGALAFEKWTEKKAPVDLMRQSALELLKKSEK